LEATKLAMKKAIGNLAKRSYKSHGREIYKTFLLLDGNFRIKSEITQKSIIKGDQKVFSIAAASIIAKVTRDRIMQKMHKKYPQYGFDSHKGYGTFSHFENLKNFGPCKIHRKSFYPIRHRIPQSDLIP
jgi:ribonuclease HII